MKKLLAMLLAVTTVAGTATAYASAPEAQPGLSVGSADNTELQGGLLTPGETYQFPLLLTDESGTRPLDGEEMKGHLLRLEALAGKEALDHGRLVEKGGKQYLEFKTKAGWPADQTLVEYRLRYLDKGDGKVQHSLDLSFSVGYNTASDESIADLQEGEFVQVDMSRPVYTADQLEKLARLNGYGKVTFAAGDWQFTANVSGMKGINLLANHNAVQDILERFPEHDFKFVTFPAGPAFKGSAALSVDVSDIDKDFEGKFFVYRYLNGKLTREAFSYREEDRQLVLPTNRLGRFVITDREIPDGTVIFGNGAFSENAQKPGETTSDKKPTTSQTNPGTGSYGLAGPFVSILLGAAVFAAAMKRK